MKDLMNKKEVASYLCLSTRTIDNLVLEGKLIKSKQGRNTVFKKENIIKYKEEYVIDEIRSC
jgi:excisionase family DNA binding protein